MGASAPRTRSAHPAEVDHDGRASVHVPLLLWTGAALLLAATRVPYDDEWFSLELALDTGRAAFWRALENDLHPPWVALVDRVTGLMGGGALSLQALRVAASAAAIGLLGKALARRWNLPRWAFALAALHPVVLFYAGALRWYPWLLLAHALRAYAIWRGDRLRMGSGLAFVAGSGLGFASSYVDAPFLVHDAIWLTLRGRARGPGANGDAERTRWQHLAPVLVASAVAVLGLYVASPLGEAVHRPFQHAHAGGHPWGVAIWGALGLAGEAALPFPWMLTALVCPVAAALAFRSLWRVPESRASAVWCATYASTWVTACAFGVWHPRYSLMVWVLATALVVRLVAHGSKAERAIGLLFALHLAISLTLTVRGTGFIKADLNRLASRDCEVIQRLETGLLVVPYPRLAALIEDQCPTPLPVLVLPSIRMHSAPSEQLAELAQALPQHRRAVLLETHVDSSLTATQRRAAGFLDAHCTRRGATRFGSPPHPRLRPDRPPDYRRYTAFVFDCPGPR